MSNVETYDITIIGAGMAGATLAVALHQSTKGALKIAVVESYAHDHSQHPGFDARTLALSYGTSKALDSLNLWTRFQPFVSPIRDIEVSDKGHLGLVDMSADTLNVPALGYVVELHTVADLYHKKLAEIGCDYFCPAVVESINRQQTHCDIELVNTHTQQKSEFKTKLLVAADGANSKTVQLMGIQTQSIDYKQHAIIANVISEKAHQSKAYERFTSQGPLAFLPMNDLHNAPKSSGTNAVVWCVSSEKVDELMALDTQDFCQALQQQFGWRLGKLIDASKRHAYPLIQQQAEMLISHRFVSVGNAAQALHPIAGQGFNLGIRDVMQLAASIRQYFENSIMDRKQKVHAEQKDHHDPIDVGDYSILAHYRTNREADRQATLNLTGGLVRVFSNDFLSLRIGRNFGLFALDFCPSLSRSLIQHTMNGNNAIDYHHSTKLQELL